jgi:hypothetical protein
MVVQKYVYLLYAHLYELVADHSFSNKPIHLLEEAHDHTTEEILVIEFNTIKLIENTYCLVFQLLHV